jgi:predicted  nucleic acid-binding Zn-ribbon protein
VKKSRCSCVCSLQTESAAPRNEAAVLAERIVDLKTKVKLWGAQTKLEAQSEVKILLTKVDAAYNQIAQLERSLGDAHKHIEGLHSGKRDLLSRMGLMVPVSELQAAKAESSKLRETIDELKGKLRSSQDEIEKQASTIQVYEHTLVRQDNFPGPVCN